MNRKITEKTLDESSQTSCRRKIESLDNEQFLSVIGIQINIQNIFLPYCIIIWNTAVLLLFARRQHYSAAYVYNRPDYNIVYQFKFHVAKGRSVSYRVVLLWFADTAGR